jgi:FtsZ-binding cell division protein ZapB
VNQEDIDKMVTGSPVLDERAAVEVAFRNYERYIAAPLKGVLDRDWKDEDLYAVAQIAANAITYRDREIKSLKERIAKMEQEAIERNNSHEHMRERLQWLQNGPDPYNDNANKLSYWQKLVVTEALQGFKGVSALPKPVPPLTHECVTGKAAKLAAYFEKRAKENTRRSEKLEAEKNVLKYAEQHIQNEHSSYYFSGKADSYTRASQKVKEAFGLEATSEQKAAPAKPAVSAAVVPAPEKWIVEIFLLASDSWVRSGNPGVSGVFSSKAEADKAISQQTDSIIRRARRIE